MAKDIKKTEEHPDEKKTEAKSGSKCDCGCGCMPPLKK